MYEIPQLALDDASGKDSQARDENVIISSSPAYGHFQISRQEHDTKEDKEGKGLDQTYEIPHLSARYDTTVKANPARSENVITSSNQHINCQSTSLVYQSSPLVRSSDCRLPTCGEGLESRLQRRYDSIT